MNNYAWIVLVVVLLGAFYGAVRLVRRLGRVGFWGAVVIGILCVPIVFWLSRLIMVGWMFSTIFQKVQEIAGLGDLLTGAISIWLTVAAVLLLPVAISLIFFRYTFKKALVLCASLSVVMVGMYFLSQPREGEHFSRLGQPMYRYYKADNGRIELFPLAQKYHRRYGVELPLLTTVISKELDKQEAKDKEEQKARELMEQKAREQELERQRQRSELEQKNKDLEQQKAELEQKAKELADQKAKESEQLRSELQQKTRDLERKADEISSGAKVVTLMCLGAVVFCGLGAIYLYGLMHDIWPRGWPFVKKPQATPSYLMRPKDYHLSDQLVSITYGQASDQVSSQDDDILMQVESVEASKSQTIVTAWFISHQFGNGYRTDGNYLFSTTGDPNKRTKLFGSDGKYYPVVADSGYYDEVVVKNGKRFPCRKLKNRYTVQYTFGPLSPGLTGLTFHHCQFEPVRISLRGTWS